MEYILHNCSYPDDEVPALLLFEHSNAPPPLLKETLKWVEDGHEQRRKIIDVELKCRGSEVSLRLTWDAFFVPNLDGLVRHVS